MQQDGGCMATGASRLGITSAAQTINARACSAAFKVELQNACGAPVVAGAAVTVTFTSSTTTTEFFGDGACIGKPSSFQIPAGSSTLSVYFNEQAQTMPTLTASATGLDAGTQTQTVACAAGEKACGVVRCVPTAACCLDADCTGAKLCETATNECHVPKCVGLPANCFSGDYKPYDGGTIQITGSAFSPKCVQVGFNASVKFSGFGHSVEQSCGDNDLNISNFGSTTTVTGFSGFNAYGFRCMDHPTNSFQVGAIKR